MPCCGLVNAPSINVITKEGEERLHQTLCQVCRAIIENWSSLGDHELKHEGISGGITNLLYRVRALRDVVPSSALVRVFGDKTEIIIDRKKETDILRQLSDMGFSVLLYGSFGNGRIEGWKDMRPLQPKEMGERYPRDICGAIASELAKMHELSPIELNNLEKLPQVFVHIDRFQTNVETIDFNDSPERAKLYKRINIKKMAIETEWLRRVLPSDRNDYGAQLFAKLPEGPRVDAARFAMACVFAHNDLLSGNVLIDEQNPPTIQFVDFEYACYNHRAHDIANHLTEYSGFDGDWGKNHPADEDILHFLEEYLKTSSEGSKLLAKYGNSERKVFIDELLAWVSRFCCLSRVYWGYWAIIQARYSPIDFDFLDYSRCSFVGHYYYKGLYSHLFFDH